MQRTHFLEFMSLTPSITVPGSSIYYSTAHTAMKDLKHWYHQAERPEPPAIARCCWGHPRVPFGGLTGRCGELSAPGARGCGAGPAAAAPGEAAARGAAKRRPWGQTARTTPTESTGFPFWSQRWSQALKTRQEEFLKAAYWHRHRLSSGWTSAPRHPARARPGALRMMGTGRCRETVTHPMCLPADCRGSSDGWDGPLSSCGNQRQVKWSPPRRKRGGSRSCFNILY